MRNPVPFGKYILLDRVSVGGMAEVFKGKSFGVEGFEKVIAIKRILPSMGEDRDFIDMFIDEAKIAGSLAHANICQIFELGKIDNCHFIAMEYIWGKDLLQVANRLRKQRQVMEIPMACFIISKVCEGLDYAHRKRDPLGAPMNIVHRDCSPQNIIVSYEGEVKLIDFGIAKAESRSSKTVAGVLKGKFGYMSPEQVRGLALDRRSDIFAVGTVLYECLTGERLFQSESDFSTLEKVRNVSIFPPSHFNRNIPPELERVVMKALARNPEERYQHAGELQADLQQLLMKQEQVFTAKSLGSWVKRSFEVELARERSLMEGYRKIGPDGTSREPSTPAPEVLQPSMPVGSLLGEQSQRSRTVTGEFDEGPTEVFGELTIDEQADDIAEIVAQVRAREQAPISRRPQPMPAAGRRADTNPPAPSGAGAAHAISEEPTVAKVVVREKTPPPRTFEPTADPARAPAFPIVAPPTGQMQVAAPVEAVAFGPTSAVTPLPSLRPEPTARRSSLFKDIGIGLGIAALVLVIFAGAKVLFFGDKPGTRTAEASAGTIAVTVPDNDPAEVHINGRLVGALEGGEAFKLSELQPDRYEIVVRRAGVPDCVRTIELAAKALEVVNCPFAKPEPKPSQLMLSGAMDGVTVFVDGQQVTEQAAREAMELAAGVDHRVIVHREGAPEYAFTVRLAPGQQTMHIVPSPRAVVKTRRARRDTKSDGGSGSLFGSNSLTRDMGDTKGKKDKRDRKGTKKDRRDRKGAKKSADLTRDREKDSKKPAVEKGYLVAWTTPWARVFIDGKDTGKMTPIAPRAKIALKPGKHRVTFVVGKERFSYRVVIEPGETRKLREELPVGTSD